MLRLGDHRSKAFPNGAHPTGLKALLDSLTSPSPSADEAALQRRLAARNEQRLRPTLEERFGPAEWEQERVDRLLEEEFVARERAELADQLARVPREPDPFLAWFERLREDGPGQNDELFPWLAEEASLDQLRWFLGQEVAGEAGFEDLLALTQLKMPVAAKLEMARNYWDEMGRGQETGMHGPLLARLAHDLDVRLPADEILPEPLALANLMSALAFNRRYAFQSIGALGVIELTAPGRAVMVNAGLRRLGCPPATRKYFALHATLDVQHAQAWKEHVLRPLVAADPRCAVAFAEGALMRLRAGARCFAAYRAHLKPAVGSRMRAAASHG